MSTLLVSSPCFLATSCPAVSLKITPGWMQGLHAHATCFLLWCYGKQTTYITHILRGDAFKVRKKAAVEGGEGELEMHPDAAQRSGQRGGLTTICVPLGKLFRPPLTLFNLGNLAPSSARSVMDWCHKCILSCCWGTALALKGRLSVVLTYCSML